MPKKTLHKIQILGSENSKNLPILLEYMDIKIIPDILGGKNTTYSNKHSENTN